MTIWEWIGLGLAIGVIYAIAKELWSRRKR